MTPVRLVRLGVATAALALVTAGTTVPADAHDNGTFQLQDRCDPETFPAFIGCVDNDQGSVGWERFLEELGDGGEHHWAIDPSERTIRHTDDVVAHNVGGEFHTFTEVTRFGTGCVPELNAAVAPAGPALIMGGKDPCLPENAEAVFIGSAVDVNQRRSFGQLSTGVHRFECLIHPWMRTTVTVR